MVPYHRASTIVILTVAALAACAARDAAQVSRSQFQELGWLIGVWRGSGGAYPAFFEEYRLINDSTIQMRAFTDSTLQIASDSSTIGWHNGTVESRSATSVYVATEVTPTRIRFVRPGTRSGHTFTRGSANEWTATLDATTSQGQPTVYLMRRIQR